MENEFWHQQTGESAKSYARFHAFLMLGVSRSLLAAYKEELLARNSPILAPSCVPSSWKQTARQWRWSDRAAAFDAEQERRAQSEYSERLLSLKYRQMEIMEMLLDQVEDMLRFPLDEVTNVGGTTIIRPARWTFDTVPKLMAMIDRLDAAPADTFSVTVTTEKHQNREPFSAMAIEAQILEILERAAAHENCDSGPENHAPLRLVGGAKRL